MPIVNPRILTIEVTDDEIIAHLVDGRTISVPLVWSWRLVNATEKQRQHWEILGDGEGVRWPDIDEDLGVDGMLYGSRPIVPQNMLGPTNDKHKSGYIICTMSAYYQHGGCGYIRPLIRQMAKLLPAAPFRNCAPTSIRIS